MKLRYFLLGLVMITIHISSEAQQTQCDPCVNSEISAMPFLRITPNSRSGAMGDVGVALSADPDAMHFNAARLAFIESNLSANITYTPWLSNLGINDVFLAYLSGVKKLDNGQALGVAMRFFDMGDIRFFDESGNPLPNGHPYEFSIEAAYARKLSDKFSLSLTPKFAFSDLASGTTVQGNEIKVATSFAIDIGSYYTTRWSNGNDFSFGAAITNLGSKVSYIEDATQDFIPTNLGIGTAYKLNMDQYNSITFALDLNKLMIPTPCRGVDCDLDPANGVPDWREKSLFDGVFGSFTDAPFSEEMQELNYSFGMEYWYAEQFAFRTGYFYEHQYKGDRQFLTFGIGLKYNVMNFDVSYLASTTAIKSPIGNTLRFTLGFDFDKLNSTSPAGE